nr:MAG TPA: hypothetical protein [Caudoviricetes sp.]
MLIRSQDKNRLINLDNTRELRFWECAQGFDITDCVCPIGHYSTKAKAVKVLDMIQEAYGDSEYTKYVIPEVCKSLSMKPKTEENKAHAGEIGEMLKKGMTFQMPEDGSVEL